jgi:hypothetical protein
MFTLRKRTWKDNMFGNKGYEHTRPEGTCIALILMEDLGLQK